ncbi:MAG: metal-dependent hydrolase [Candidatus Brevundimonas colombiensis]|uniref:Metal-dependent hydrolase n=1 Tax=Candidatus Brevundimonas colombiensis TaxID=3121376 RepID=A0AAJ6BJX6_9CAUL|nr:metal-dependent hydrolase [Brevundimonas sp.]WEK40325.1 MAG: metal-dependent hydrolase [Brevundimonas sp.]
MAKSATPADLQIKPRDLHIDREAVTPRWWLNNDPFGAAVMNALSLTFPDGERFFIQSVKRFARDAPPKLAADIRAFTVQEGAHTREHMAFNAITERAGYQTAAIEAYVTERLDIARARPPLAQLAATMALEHFTAAFAHRLLADPDLLKGSPHDLARLWRWHSIEEIEHKGVAYDVFLHATRAMSPLQRWRLRRWAMLLTTLLFTKTVRETSLMLLKQDGIVGWRARFGLFRWLWLKPGLYRRMIGDYFAFYKPGFHPWQVDDRDLIVQAEAGLAQPA